MASPGKAVGSDTPHMPKPGKCGAPVLLACGNALRQDDGVGLEIAAAAERAFSEAQLRVVAVQQWTPELAAEIATTALAIFVDASATDEPGAIRVRQLCSPTSANIGQSRSTSSFEWANDGAQTGMWGAQEPALSQKARQGWGTQAASICETHQLGPAQLLALAQEVCGHAPERAFVITVGAGSFQYDEEVSGTVRQAVPRVVRLVGNLVTAFAPER